MEYLNKNKDNCRKPPFYEVKKVSYKEFGTTPYDWSNESKLRLVHSYFFVYNNYNTQNLFIKKSTFGKKTEVEIKEEILHWFNACIGAYNEIILK